MKVGVIGLGFMGATHLKAYSEIDGVEVGAVASSNRTALRGDLRGAGGNLGGSGGIFDFSAVQKFTDWHALIDDPTLDIIDICLPTHLHWEVALRAIASGKHVFLEKPMALDVTQCEQILAAANRSDRIFMVAQVLRFWPEYVALHHRLHAGAIGAIGEALFFRQCGLPDWSAWLSDETRSGGAVLDLLVHDIDQALDLFGVPESVEARSLGPVDTLDATLHYREHGPIRIQGGWYPTGTPFSMGFCVHGDRGGLEFKEAALRAQAGQHWDAIDSPPGDGYVAEISYFLECCRSGSPPGRCLPLESARAVELALLLKKSRDQGGSRLQCIM